jgi:hypothetical protein
MVCVWTSRQSFVEGKKRPERMEELMSKLISIDTWLGTIWFAHQILSLSINYTRISLSSYIYYAIYCNTPVTVVKIVRHGRKLACRLRNPPSHDGSSSACDEDNQRAVIIDTHIYIDKREREETLMATRVNWNVVEWLLYARRGMRVVSRETKFRDDMDDDDTVHRPFPMIV